jgi:hypothetical protein
MLSSAIEGNAICKLWSIRLFWHGPLVLPFWQHSFDALRFKDVEPSFAKVKVTAALALNINFRSQQDDQNLTRPSQLNQFIVLIPSGE